MTDTPQDDGPPDIWLEPKCNPERCWCDVDQGDCDECDAKSVQYIRADRIAALRAENEALKAEIASLNWIRFGGANPSDKL